MHAAPRTSDNPVAKCPLCGAPITEDHPYSWCSHCGEQLPADIVAKLPTVQAQLAAGAAAAASAARASSADRSPKAPSAAGAIAIIVACCAIFAFVLFVPTRPGHASSKYYLTAIALVWFGRGIFELVAARDFRHRHPHRPNQAMQRTPTRRSPKISHD